jgi:NhaP-type Na+/H+ or K+/H+ antiporter
MELIIVLLGLGLLLGAVLGWVSFFKIQTLQKQIDVLQRS